MNRTSAPAAPVAGRGVEPPAAELFRLDPRSILRAFRAESLAFWMLSAYIFIEYVRPQMIYRSIDVLPWGRLTLALALLTFFVSGPKFRKLHIVDLLLLGFTAVWFLSSIFAIYPEWSAEYALVYVNWLIVYFLVTHVVNTKPRFFLFLGLFLLWSLKLSQHGARTFAMRGFSFTTWGVMGPQGWFQNSGELAVQMCVFFAMSYAFVMAIRKHIRPWMFWGLMGLMPGTAALTVIASSSRGGQLALAAVILALIAQSKHRVRGVLIGSVVFAGLWFIVPDEQRERFDAMGDDRTSTTRTEYWDDGIEITKKYPVLGIGYRNWLPYYRTYYNPVGELPHNIFVEAGAELGYSGFFMLLFLMAGTLVLNRRTRRLARRIPEWGPFIRASAFGLDAALAGYAVAGMFVTILYYPYFWVNLAFTAALYEVARRSAKEAKRAAAMNGANGARRVPPMVVNGSRSPRVPVATRVGRSPFQHLGRPG